MFDFERLDVYREAKLLNRKVLSFIRKRTGLHRFLADQLFRASVSVVINIAEGSGKFSKKDRSNFYTIARGSVYECVSLFEIIFEENLIDKEGFDRFYSDFEKLSRMLFKLIESQRL